MNKITNKIIESYDRYYREKQGPDHKGFLSAMTQSVAVIPSVLESHLRV